MMTVIILAHQFKTASPIAKVEALDHAHFFEHMHRAIDGGKVTLPASLPHLQENFPVCEGVRVFPEDLQYGRAGTGHFSRLAPQKVFKRGQILLLPGMRMGRSSHASTVS